MYLTGIQTIIIIFSVALGAMLTRFLPFILFPENKETPKFITYLGRVLPAAMMGLLIIYCLRNISIGIKPHGIPELISIASIIILHRWRNNVLLSIGGGTVIYMFLVQAVFK
jgi:branched-subunit amino acid transport protein AzlD